ncbi:MAG: hypothetical protein ACXAEL_06680 [Candidatus Hodarchaeales archaeon]|jgi:hypothetical protein
MSIELLFSDMGIPTEDVLVFPDYIRSKDAHSYDISEEFSTLRRLWVIDGTSAPFTAFRLSNKWLTDAEMVGLRADFTRLDALRAVEFYAFSPMLTGRLVVEYEETLDQDYLEFYSGTPNVRGKAILRSGLTMRRDLYMISHHALPTHYFRRVYIEPGGPLPEMPPSYLGWCTLNSETSFIPDPQIVQINIGDFFAYRNIPPSLEFQGETYRQWVLARVKSVLSSFPNLQAILISTDKLPLMYRGWHTEPLQNRSFDELAPLFIPSRFQTRYYLERPFQELKSVSDFRDMGSQRNYFLFTP